MLTVYLFRHGEVENSAVKAFNGHTDVSLSEEGVRQFEVIAKKMKGKKIDAIYASDLGRAKTGATILGAPHLLKPRCFAGLRELNFGDWDGLNVDEVSGRFPEEMNKRAGDLLNHRIKNGETLSEFGERVINCFQKIVAHHGEGSIACVAHGGVNRVLILWALKSPLSAVFSVRQDYGCMNIINFFKDGYSELEQMNVRLF